MHRNWFLGCERGHAFDFKDFVTRQAQRLAVFSRLEFQRQHAHADKVAPVNAFIAFSDDRAYAKQPRALGRPIARGTRAVLFSRDAYQRTTALPDFSDDFTNHTLPST